MGGARGGGGARARVTAFVRARVRDCLCARVAWRACARGVRANRVPDARARRARIACVTRARVARRVPRHHASRASCARAREAAGLGLLRPGGRRWGFSCGSHVGLLGCC